MKVRLVSHASVLITCGYTKIWTDPWLIGKAFNDSWSLWPEPEFSAALLEGVQYLWLSHEHPDHLNFPTLASLPARVKQEIKVLFQRNNAERIFAPLRKLGFRNFQVLDHRRVTKLDSEVSVYCYRVGTLDSCLGAIAQGQTVFDVNDARLNQADYSRILNDIGPVDVVLNQFSIAVKESVVDYERHARAAGRDVLQSISADHQGLRAKVTVPFASFMYFSCIDNANMNAFSNKPREVFEFCKDRGQEVVVLYPGDEYVVNQPHDSFAALTRYDESYSRLRLMAYDVSAVVHLSELTDAFQSCARSMRSRYPQILLGRLRPLNVRIPDLDETVTMTIADGSLTRADKNAQTDVEIYSQPLHYCLAQPWGMGTLTISGRFNLLRNERNWKAFKALFALNNAEVYLRPHYLFRRQNWGYLKDRLNGMMRYRYRTRSRAREFPAPSLRQQP